MPHPSYTLAPDETMTAEKAGVFVARFASDVVAKVATVLVHVRTTDPLASDVSCRLYGVNELTGHARSPLSATRKPPRDRIVAATVSWHDHRRGQRFAVHIAVRWETDEIVLAWPDQLQPPGHAVLPELFPPGEQ